MNQVWLRIDCAIDLNDEELNGLLKFNLLNEPLAEKILTKGLFGSGLLYRSKEEYISPNKRGTAVSFEELTNTIKRLLSENKRDIPPLKKSIEIKLMEDIKMSLLRKVNIQEVFSEKVLEKLTQAIICDEYEALLECDAEELKSLIGHKVDMSNYDELTRLEKDLFIKIYAEKWGLETLGLSIIDWQDQFVDYIDYQEGASEEYEAFFDNFNQYNYLTLTN